MQGGRRSPGCHSFGTNSAHSSLFIVSVCSPLRSPIPPHGWCVVSGPSRRGGSAAQLIGGSVDRLHCLAPPRHCHHQGHEGAMVSISTASDTPPCRRSLPHLPLRSGHAPRLSLLVEIEFLAAPKNGPSITIRSPLHRYGSGGAMDERGGEDSVALRSGRNSAVHRQVYARGNFREAFPSSSRLVATRVALM